MLDPAKKIITARDDIL